MTYNVFGGTLNLTQSVMERGTTANSENGINNLPYLGNSAR